MADPRILPSLQEELPKIYNAENLLKNYNRITVKPYLPMFGCGLNKYSLGDMFGGFLNHYANLEFVSYYKRIHVLFFYFLQLDRFESHIISVRLGKLLKKPQQGNVDNGELSPDGGFGHKISYPETGLVNVEGEVVLNHFLLLFYIFLLIYS